MEQLYRYLPYELTDYIKNYRTAAQITEIRMRADNNISFTENGRMVKTDIYTSKADINDVLFAMCEYSQNAYEDDIANGFITLKGGYRVGIGGEFYYSADASKYLIKQLNSLNIRIPKKSFSFKNQEIVFDTEPIGMLIIGPPHSGKTSLIRMYSKYLANKYRICICDERREIYEDNFDCDVLKGIKKADAISMATRTLNPQFIICDEIGLKEETDNIISAVNTGVEFICSVHGKTMEDIYKRPDIKKLVDTGIFKRFVLLGDKEFIIKEIKDV